MQQPFGFSFLRGLGLLCLVSLVAYSQGTTGSTSTTGGLGGGSRGNHVIRGKIFLPSGRLPEYRMRVLLEVSTGGIYAEAFSDTVGNFEFRQLPNNNYRVVVPSDNQTYETAQEVIEVSSNMSRTYTSQLYLREKESDQRRSTQKMISAASFEQDVPKAAKKPYEQGLKKLKDGKTEEAVAQFQEALKIYPEYVAALGKLGEAQAGQQKFAEAEAAFQRALELSPKYPPTHVSYGMLLVGQKRYPEAIEHLETANKLDEAFPMAHLYLGIALMEKQPQADADLVRAEKAFDKALALGGAQIAQAHKLLFNLHVRRRDYGRAATDLEAYLKLNPTAPDAPQVQEMIAKVKKAAQSAPTKPE